MKKHFITFTLLYASIMATAQTQINNELKGIINQSFSYYPKVQEAQTRSPLQKNKLMLQKRTCLL
jgi:hypothetical protein